MSLEKILERIERDAQNEVGKIKKRASEAADEILMPFSINYKRVKFQKISQLPL